MTDTARYVRRVCRACSACGEHERIDATRIQCASCSAIRLDDEDALPKRSESTEQAHRRLLGKARPDDRDARLQALGFEPVSDEQRANNRLVNLGSAGPNGAPVECSCHIGGSPYAAPELHARDCALVAHWAARDANDVDVEIAVDTAVALAPVMPSNGRAPLPGSQPTIEERRAAWLAEGIRLGVHVLDSQDEDGRPTFAPVNALVVLDNVWVAGASEQRDGVLVLGCRRRPI